MYILDAHAFLLEIIKVFAIRNASQDATHLTTFILWITASGHLYVMLILYCGVHPHAVPPRLVLLACVCGCVQGQVHSLGGSIRGYIVF